MPPKPLSRGKVGFTKFPQLAGGLPVTTVEGANLNLTFRFTFSVSLFSILISFLIPLLFFVTISRYLFLSFWRFDCFCALAFLANKKKLDLGENQG